jgi:hypothetical protein
MPDWAELDQQRPPAAVRAGATRALGYTPPPPTAPPPVGWRPDHVVHPVPPRSLPAQDHAGLDAAELRASRITVTIGAAAAAVMAILLAVLCGQLLS